MIPTYRRLLRALPVAAVLALAVTACSSTTGGVAAISTSNVAADGGGGLPTEVTGGGGSPTEMKTFALDMQVRVVNLWTPIGSKDGGAIDVWVGNPQYSGKKIKTVPYGEVSEFFAPEVSDPMGQGRPGEKNISWSFSFYAAGKTDDASALIDQGETSAPGQKLTMVLLPTDPTAQGASIQVFADDVGSDPSGSGFDAPAIPAPASGKALLMLNGTATQYLGTKDQMPTYVLSTPDGSCSQYLDTSTGKLHDDPHITELVGGTQSIDYLVDPGTKIRVSKIDASKPTPEQCAAAPVVDSTDTGLGDGGRAYGFLWGPDAAKPKLTIVPLG